MQSEEVKKIVEENKVQVQKVDLTYKYHRALVEDLLKRKFFFT